jgi:hypothetical protein
MSDDGFKNFIYFVVSMIIKTILTVEMLQCKSLVFLLIFLKAAISVKKK